MSSSPAAPTPSGLDSDVATQLLQSQNTHTQTTTNAMQDMHRQSMQAMTNAMQSMQASQQSSEQKFMQLSHSMEAGFSNAMMSMASMFTAMMNMVGPALMGGMSGGVGTMVMGGGNSMYGAH